MRYTLLFVLLLLGISCSDRNSVTSHSTESALHLNPEKTADVKLSSFINSIKFTELSTGGDNFFATVDKLLIAENKVFILDKYQALTLFVYNLEGEFLYKIDNYGRGPGEYEAPSDFAIDNQ